MTADFDVLVIGGGLAGSSLAALTAAAGLRTAVMERARFPRDKVCGEFVSAEGCGVLERLGLRQELEQQGGVRMHACRITDTRGTHLDAELPTLTDGSRDGLGVTRALLDSALIRLAADRGAEILERTEAISPRIDDGIVRGFRGRCIGVDRELDFTATIVVAADGRRSVLGRALHPNLGDPRRSGPGSWFGLKTHLEGPPGRLGGRIELHLFDGGYVGLGAVEGGRINLCLLTTVRALRACGGRPDRLLAERVFANPAARAVVGDLSRRGSWHSIGPLRFAVRQPSSHGALFVGDAAGTIDPYSGEGMSHALRSAEIALPYVLEAVARGGVERDIAGAYSRAWMGAFRPVTRRVRRLGALLERPRLASALLRLLSRGGRRLVPSIVAATRSLPASTPARSANRRRARPT